MYRNIAFLKLKLNNMKLERKILISVMAIEIFFVTISIILVLKIVTSKYEKLIYSSLESSSTLIVHELNNRLDDVVTMSNVVRSDSTLQSVLTELTFPTKDNSYHFNEEIYRVLETYYLAYKAPYISFAAIYNPKITAYTRETTNYSLSDETMHSLIDISNDADGSAVWVHYSELGNQLFLAREIKKIEYLKFDNLGSFIVCINMDKLFAELSKLSKEMDNSNWVLYQNGEIIYSSQSLIGIDVRPYICEDSNFHITKINGKTYFYINGKTEMADWNYIHMIPFDEINNAKLFSLRLYAFVIFIGIILSFFFLHLVIRQLTKHLDILVQRMSMFAKNYQEFPNVNYDYTMRQDEIGIIHVQFEKMALEIQTLINEKYRQDLLIKEAQLSSLESQMNPHFIYNTLESINWRAKAIHEKEISDIAQALGHFLRMTVSNKAIAFTLRDELSIVESYMTIQRIRFEQRLNYSVNIPDSILDAFIPKLSIQPLLENSVHYALEQMTEECFISLSAAIEGDNVCIYVKNTGSEFPDNLLQKLRIKEISGAGLGIALLNIDERIKLLFSNEYGLSFYNEADLAVAKMTIPYKLVV